MKIFITMLLFIVCSPFVAAQSYGTWHPLTKLTPAEKSSESYKFMVKKFGAQHIVIMCDPDTAALVGENYLIQVFGDRNTAVFGQAMGNGSNLQEALDSAMDTYIPAERVREIQAQMREEEKELEQAKKEYRKKCCAGQP